MISQFCVGELCLLLNIFFKKTWKSDIDFLAQALLIFTLHEVEEFFFFVKFFIDLVKLGWYQMLFKQFPFTAQVAMAGLTSNEQNHSIGILHIHSFHYEVLFLLILNCSCYSGPVEKNKKAVIACYLITNSLINID